MRLDMCSSLASVECKLCIVDFKAINVPLAASDFKLDRIYSCVCFDV